MSKESRAVTASDLEIIDRAIADHEKFQTLLYTLQRVLGEIGKLDIADIKRGVEGEQGRLAEARKQADTAQQQLNQLQQQIADKQRELAAVEKTIGERTVVAGQLNESYLHLRNLLAAA